jgi:hypothetical protein
VSAQVDTVALAAELKALEELARRFAPNLRSRLASLARPERCQWSVRPFELLGALR